MLRRKTVSGAHASAQRLSLIFVSAEPDWLHASKNSSQAIFARQVFGEFLHICFVLLWRVDAWRNIPELLTLSVMDQFFQIAVFKLIRLFVGEIIGEDDFLDHGTFHHRLGQFPLKKRADVF